MQLAVWPTFDRIAYRKNIKISVCITLLFWCEIKWPFPLALFAILFLLAAKIITSFDSRYLQFCVYLCSFYHFLYILFLITNDKVLETRIGNWNNVPRHGSFLTKNSSRATQPPPTRTITVLLRIRTRRSFCESPNWKGGICVWVFR